jgi:ribonuclease HI
MGRNDADRPDVIDPESLTRDELVALVRELQHALRQRPAGTGRQSTAALRSPVPAAGVDITLVFDGGSLGNPGLGYGSYEIVTPDGSLAARQIEFGDNMTNNQAEFHALIAGLTDLLQRLGPEATARSLEVRGDSQLVIRGLSGAWRVKHPGLRPLYEEASALLGRFRSVELKWQPRAESVKAFGH